MGIKHVLGVLIWIIFFNSLILQTNALSPYKILGVPRTATDSEVDVKYRQLRGKYRRNRMKKNMVKQAYDQIMIERKFQEGIQSIPPEPQIPLIPQPKHIDQAYVYGYKLADQFDDGRYFKEHFNETLHILERLQNSEENKKTAKMLLFMGGLILKFLPCLIIFCLCKHRGRGQASIGDVMARAGAGYANFGRRMRQR